MNVYLEEDVKLVPIASNTNLFIEALVFATAESDPTEKKLPEKRRSDDENSWCQLLIDH